MSGSAFDELVALREAYEAVVVGRGQEVVDCELQRFLSDFPEVGAVTWRQFTPTFNDGDPCVFSVGELYYRLDRSCPLVEGASPSEDYYDFDYDDESGGGPAWFDEYAFISWEGSRRVFRSERHRELYEATRSLDKGFREVRDVLKAVFKDNVKVTCTRDGYEVEGYEGY